MSTDIGNLCVQCGLDTSFGSGRFVNRFPADDGVHKGWLCPDCQADNCDACVLEKQGADDQAIDTLVETLTLNGETGALCDHHSPEDPQA